MSAYEVDWDAGTENTYEDWRDRVTADDDENRETRWPMSDAGTSEPDFQAPGTSPLPQTTAVVDSTAASQETSEEAA